MIGTASCAVCIVTLVAAVALAGPEVFIFTDGDRYTAGDTIEVGLSARNLDEEMSVGVYIGLLGPDGDICTLQFEGWSDRILPWIPEIYVPSEFELHRTPFWAFGVPCESPPIEEDGEYSFAAVLTSPGTVYWLCDASFAPFTIESPKVKDYYVSVGEGDDRNDGSEGSPWRTVTHALSAAKGASTAPAAIHVAPGTYSASTNCERFPLDVRSWVTLVGESPYCAILDAEGTADHVIRCYEATGVVIEGFTIKGGAADGETQSDRSGAGIFCCRGLVNIVNNIITESRAVDSGGGIYCCESSPTVSGNTMSRNWAGNRGGGICCTSGSSPVISGNTISENSSDTGGGIYCDDGSPTILNNAIFRNWAGIYGGGIFCDESSPTVSNNTIAENSAFAQLGGGVYCASNSSSAIVDCVIWGNGDDLYDCSGTYCCIEDGDFGEGNVNDDPSFMTGAFGGLYLDPQGPCIDAGSMSSEEAGLSDMTTQADGTPDVGILDMGAHYVIPSGTSPAAEIDSISPNPAARGRDVIHLVGHAEDTDGSILQYEWHSDVDGILGRNRELYVSAFNLALGTHSIRFRAMDNSKLWSIPDYDSLEIQLNPLREVFVDGQVGDDSNDGTEANPFKTIGFAVEMMTGTELAPGTVFVKAGTYSSSTNRETFPLRIPSWTALVGDVSGGTILDAEDDSDHVISISDASGVAIEGFTIMGGYADGPEELDLVGAGIFCHRGSVKLADCLVVGNSASGAGGGIYCSESSAVISRSLLADNLAEMGGGLYCCSGGSPTILDSTISDNSAESGGGIYCSDSPAIITDNTITKNSALGDEPRLGRGGGIYCSGHRSPTVSDNLILRNTASGDGAGMYCSDGSSPTIAQNMIMANSSEGHGGGICCSDGSSPAISGNTLSSNSADVGGGLAFGRWSSPMATNNAITANSAWIGGGAFCAEYSSPSIFNNAIVGNSAVSRGGGLCNSDRVYARVADCIIWGNGDDLYNCSARFCCVEDDDAGEGNIHKDPMLLFGPCGDSYLDSRSPCVDAGSQSAEETGLSDKTTQVDGSLDTGAVDMGVHYGVPTGLRPTGKIDSMAPNPAVRGYDAVRFSGNAEDVDGAVALCEWYSDLDGILGIGEELQISALGMTPGAHTIRFRVMDDDRLWSIPDYAVLIVEVYPVRNVFVDGQAGNDSNEGSQASPFKTIAHAIEMVLGTGSDPGTVSVTPGTYSASTNGETFPLVMTSWLNLLGEGTAGTILDAEGGAEHVIYSLTVTGSTIQRLTITGGAAGQYGFGGGLFCIRSSLRIHDTAITGNTAGYGGGIACLHGPTIISNNVIRDNSADDGGAIYCSADSAEPNENATVERNAIYENSATYGGGGICCQGSSPLISSNTITGNTAHYGAGVECFSSSAEIYGNTISGNLADVDGGGIECWNCDSLSIECNTISDNTGSSNGGGMYFSSCSPTIFNNVIVDNSTEGNGGGIYCCWNSSPTVSNNTITDNRVGLWGGGICCFDEGSRPTITECVFWGNVDDIISCPTTYCSIGDPDQGEGNIFGDPMFVTGPLGDYYLHPDSPCVDSGSRTAEEAGLSDRTTQADGTPDTGTVDMGYHYPLP
ncbi:MAG: DUF1565 domain-containing protein [Candidatus Coatesbacteria bacterium]|nr:DUF1565 domain-containing protein [Candidatus Coatesbacteria bacterium]